MVFSFDNYEAWQQVIDILRERLRATERQDPRTEGEFLSELLDSMEKSYPTVDAVSNKWM